MISFRTVQSASAAIFFLLLGGLVMGVLAVPRAATGLFTTEMAIRPWEVGVFLVALLLFGALLFRQVTLRLLMELLTGFFLLLGVWFLTWWVWGEWGLFVAAVLTLAQAWIRTVWMHNTFLLLGAVGAILYLAFLLPLLTWGALFFVLVLSEVLKGRTAMTTKRMTQSVMHRGIVPLVLFPATVLGWVRPFVQEAQSSSTRAIGVTAVVLPGIVVAHLAVMHMLLAIGVVIAVSVAAGLAFWRQWSLWLSLAVAAFSFMAITFLVV